MFSPLIGVPIVILGFALRKNPMLVVVTAALSTGVAAGLSFEQILGTFGEAFLNSRSLSMFILALPVIGILERSGLKERAQAFIGSLRAATAGRILMLYFAVREITAAVGLISFGGHAQMVRPLIAPMAEGAAEHRYGDLPERVREKIRAHAAAADNIGVFFGEDIFIAFGAVLLMQAFLEQNGIHVEPLSIGLWAIPTAIAAALIHGLRLSLLDRQIKREIEAHRAAEQPATEAEGR